MSRRTPILLNFLLMCMLTYAKSGHASDAQSMQMIFSEARAVAQWLVTNVDKPEQLILPDYLSQDEQSQLRQWYFVHQSFLTEDLANSPHQIVSEISSRSCGRTTFERNGLIEISVKDCQVETTSIMEAAMFLIGESVHHFQRGDTFADAIKIGVANAIQQTDPNAYAKLATSLDSATMGKSIIKLNTMYTNKKLNSWFIIEPGRIITMRRLPGAYVPQSNSPGLLLLDTHQSTRFASSSYALYFFDNPIYQNGNVDLNGYFLMDSLPLLDQRRWKEHFFRCRVPFKITMKPIRGSAALNMTIQLPTSVVLHNDHCEISPQLATIPFWYASEGN